MASMEVVEIKAFVPARDFGRSLEFYRDLGFTCAWSSDGLAYFHHGTSSFLLQNFYNEEHAGNFMMHLLVEDADAWWQHVEAQSWRPSTASRPSRLRTVPGVGVISSSSIRPASSGASATTHQVVGASGCFA